MRKTLKTHIHRTYHGRPANPDDSDHEDNANRPSDVTHYLLGGMSRLSYPMCARVRRTTRDVSIFNSRLESGFMLHQATTLSNVTPATDHFLFDSLPG